MFSSIEKSAPDGVLVNYLKKSEAASDEMSASSKPEGFNDCQYVLMCINAHLKFALKEIRARICALHSSLGRKQEPTYPTAWVEAGHYR